MTRLPATLIACGLAVAVLVACSSGGSKNGASDTTPPTTAAPAGPSSTVRPVDTSFTGQNSAQFCALAKTYAANQASVAGGAAPQLKAAAQDARTAITQAVTLAPAEIKPDVQVVATAFSSVVAELEKVNYDTTKLTPAAFAPLSTKEFQAAATRFTAYGRAVCGLS